MLIVESFWFAGLGGSSISASQPIAIKTFRCLTAGDKRPSGCGSPACFTEQQGQGQGGTGVAQKLPPAQVSRETE